MGDGALVVFPYKGLFFSLLFHFSFFFSFPCKVLSLFFLPLSHDFFYLQLHQEKAVGSYGWLGLGTGMRGAQVETFSELLLSHMEWNRFVYGKVHSGMFLGVFILCI